MKKQPQLLPKQRTGSRRWLLSLVLVVSAVVIYLGHQQIIDQVRVWRYQPSAEVQAIAERSALSDRGQFLFYASTPQIDDRTEFNTHCQHHTEQTVVLGCYVGQRIYLFNVTDERLDGIREVTAAHEMLHAAYERMLPHDKTRVDRLLAAQYAANQDERITKLVAIYDRLEPGQRINELHSIYGTEIAQLSPELEEYYRQYFVKRAHIVELSNRYQKVFDDITTRQTQLQNELHDLYAAINPRSSQYNDDITRLNRDIDSLNRRAISGELSEGVFQQERNAIVTRQSELSIERVAINQMVDDYDLKRQELENLNGAATSLNNSIDSLSPAPAAL